MISCNIKECELLLFNDPRENNIFLNKINEIDGIAADCALRPINKLLRIIRKIHLKNTSYGIGIWLMPWKKKVNNIDFFICIASLYSGQILKWIKRKNPKARCINYYWDNIEISDYPVHQTKKYENWTFCKEDSQKYSLKYNPQFYVENIYLSNNEIKYDVSYVGADRNGKLKDRTKLVNEIYKKIISYGFIAKFYYVSSDKSVLDLIRYDKRLSEEEYYKICSESKVILEIVESNIRWNTLRPLLAIANGKKIITNNPDIKKENFYSPDNVFVWGEDDSFLLYGFIKSEFKKIPEDRITYYKIENWIQRFLEEE